jgi:hypothetical protein
MTLLFIYLIRELKELDIAKEKLQEILYIKMEEGR